MNNVLIVGGASGIGWSIAETFVKQGDQVAIADINKTELESINKRHHDMHCFYVDVSSWESVFSMTESVIQQMGKIDVLVYSAGITKKLDLEKVDFSLWKKTLAVNLHGLFYSVKAVSSHMQKKQKGNIVIIGSGSAVSGSGGGVQYYASKGGAFGFMRSLVKELGKSGINVNVIAPRVIESEMLNSLYPTEEEKQKIIEKIPVGRLGNPDDIASLATYISGEKAGYLHGQILMLDGGRTYQGSPYKKTSRKSHS